MFDFLYTPLSWLLVRCHSLLALVGVSGSLGWAPAIVLLVVVTRLALVLPFAASGRAQSWAPRLLQIPVFLALFHVLRHLTNSVGLCSAGDQGDLVRLYSFTPGQTCGAATSSVFGAPLSGALHDAVSSTSLVVTLAVAVISAAAMLFTQLRATARATTPPAGPARTVQRTMTVLAPGSVLLSAAFLPLGVLVYLMTSNLFTAVQQALTSR